jgi:hypothetical protein
MHGFQVVPPGRQPWDKYERKAACPWGAPGSRVCTDCHDMWAIWNQGVHFFAQVPHLLLRCSTRCDCRVVRLTAGFWSRGSFSVIWCCHVFQACATQGDLHISICLQASQSAFLRQYMNLDEALGSCAVYHFDLSYWAFEKLAHPVYGLQMVDFRPVSCLTQQNLQFLPGKPCIGQPSSVPRSTI